MKFTIEQDSPVPFHTQIKERIRTALALGELRPGDTLPSIRDLEIDLGIGRAIIRRAYLELKDSGILEIRPGRRVIVNGFLRLRIDDSVAKRLEVLVTSTLKKVRKMNVSGSSFAKLLLLRALDRDRKLLSYVFVDPSVRLAKNMAAQISQLWEVPIHAASIDALPSLLNSENHQIHKIIVNYYRYEEVSNLVKALRLREHAEVVPISVKFTDKMVTRLKGLPPRSKVLLLADDRDFERHGQTFADTYKHLFGGQQIEFVVSAVSGIQDFVKLARNREHELILITNRVWDELPIEVSSCKKLSHPDIEVDRNSLEEARLAAGIIV